MNEKDNCLSCDTDKNDKAVAAEKNRTTFILDEASRPHIAISVIGELKEFLLNSVPDGFHPRFAISHGPSVATEKLVISLDHEDGRSERYEVLYVSDYSGNWQRLTPLSPTTLS